MSALEVLRIPARRDVKALAATLTTVESGKRVRATFVTPRYGTFVVTGDAVASEAAKALTLAGRFIAQGVKPDRELRLLAEESADTVDAATASDELAQRVTALAHGDLVRAGFYVRTYGSFSITGLVVWSDVADAFLVGGWFVSTAGAPSARLESLTIVATAAEHGGPVPARITGVIAEDEPAA